jgi:hypothetical protein
LSLSLPKDLNDFQLRVSAPGSDSATLSIEIWNVGAAAVPNMLPTSTS